MSRIKQTSDTFTQPAPLQESIKAIIARDCAKSLIHIVSYNHDEHIDLEIADIQALNTHLQEYTSWLHWIDVRGLQDPKLLQYLEATFCIHKLAMEDIVHVHQRPKVDEYGDCIFAVSRMLHLNAKMDVESEQVSFILTSKVLITFQEHCTENIKPLAHQLAIGKDFMRLGSLAYLMYACMDLIVDTYFTLIFKIGDELDAIEEHLYNRSNKSIMLRIHTLKLAMIQIRRTVWPERDKLNELIRTESHLISIETKTFLRDAYDHCMQIVDLIESYKDISTTLMDVSLSIINNRSNEIMKVLTVVSSIFIPLTFIAGVYGMNFSYQDPLTHKILLHNMPELYNPNGYIYTLLIMLIIAIVQVVYFWRKGWLSKEK